MTTTPDDFGLAPSVVEVDPVDLEPRTETPSDMRPDLAELGIVEIERGVCEDTFENRSALRRGKLNWDPVYDGTGKPTGLIAARSPESARERRLLSLAEKRPLLADPSNHNSDYVTGVDLIVDDQAMRLAPPWVVGATRAWLAEQNNPPAGKARPASQPTRCRSVKADGVRCMLWSSGRPKDDGLCRPHLGQGRKTGEDVERARKKLVQAATYAVDVLEELMEGAASEPVRLKASTEILDRAGVRGGVEVDSNVTVHDSRPPHLVVAERLQRLALAAEQRAAALAQQNILEAEPTEPAPDKQEGGPAE